MVASPACEGLVSRADCGMCPPRSESREFTLHEIKKPTQVVVTAESDAYPANCGARQERRRRGGFVMWQCELQKLHKSPDNVLGRNLREVKPPRHASSVRD